MVAKSTPEDTACRWDALSEQPVPLSSLLFSWEHITGGTHDKILFLIHILQSWKGEYSLPCTEHRIKSPAKLRDAFPIPSQPLPMAKDTWALQRCLVWVIPAPPQPWDTRALFLQVRPSSCFCLHTNPPTPISTTQSSTFTCWKPSPNCLQWNIYLSVWNSPPNNFWCNLHEKHPHK